MKSKKSTEEGRKERLQTLKSVLSDSDKIYADKIYAESQKHLSGGVKMDDILDAMVAAVTASFKERGLSSIPQIPEHDSLGLPMEMVFYSPSC